MDKAGNMARVGSDMQRGGAGGELVLRGEQPTGVPTQGIFLKNSFFLNNFVFKYSFVFYLTSKSVQDVNIKTVWSIILINKMNKIKK